MQDGICKNCKHNLHSDTYINCLCLRCKYAYYDTDEAYKYKSDLYEEDLIKTVEEVPIISDMYW